MEPFHRRRHQRCRTDHLKLARGMFGSKLERGGAVADNDAVQGRTTEHVRGACRKQAMSGDG
ncbi:hypothetical protein D3C87_1867370 [compost metagenome]